MTQSAVPPAMRIDLYSHYIKVTRFNAAGKYALMEYCRTLAQYGMVRVGRNQFERQMLRVYVATTKDRSEFRFHINEYRDFRQHLSRYGFTDANIELVRHEMYSPVQVSYPLRDTREPRERQVPILKYLCDPPIEGYSPSKVVTLQTGQGKTFLGLKAVLNWGVRTVLVIKGMYIDKWIEDVEGAYLFKRGDLMVVRGSDHLRALLELAKSDKLEAKFIIVSLKTMYQYLEAYEEFKDSPQFPFPVPPEKFYETLGAGIRLIDEVHQEFHTNFRQDLYTHVPLTISLSATLDSDDKFMNRMYEIVWPLKIRSPEVPYDKFIVMKGLWYTINKPEKMRYTNHMKQYSHVKFEQSIMRHVGCLNNYKNMVASIVQQSYVSVRQPGQKMLIFFATVELCTIMRDHLAALHPNLTVNRYVSEDEYEKLLNADIVVSTLQSAGTAVDIPNLRISLMTVALSSKQANIQALGRTRKLKDWPDINPEFLFLNCREIDKHRKYAEEKKVKMDGKVLSFKDIETSFRI